jgi:plasmid maintenance system antidote protein VapI
MVINKIRKKSRMRAIAPVSSGEMLEEEFLKPLALTRYRFAEDIGVSPQQIGYRCR